MGVKGVILCMKKEILKILKQVETEIRTPYLYFVEDPVSQLGPDAYYDDYIEAYKARERDHLLHSDSKKFSEEAQSNITIRQYIKLPNFAYLINQVESSYSELDRKPYIASLVLSEFKRMETDGLIVIGTQSAQEFVIEDGTVKTFGDGWDAETESVVLTTRGKSWQEYFLNQIKEQWVAVAALILSFIAIIISLYKR